MVFLALRVPGKLADAIGAGRCMHQSTKSFGGKLLEV
jgi:hypothetical protein